VKRHHYPMRSGWKFQSLTLIEFGRLRKNQTQSVSQSILETIGSAKLHIVSFFQPDNHFDC
jgi:hypothetical protein